MLGQDATPHDARDPHTLTPRALNRALLARQLLIKRAPLPVDAALEHLVGLQAQASDPPYFALWARLQDFHPDHLSALVRARRVVRMALMRSTLFLVTARDGLGLRPLLQPVLERGLQGVYGKQLKGIDRARLAAAGRALVEEAPRLFSDLGTRLQSEWPDRDAAALAAAIRTDVPLVQTPPRGLWGESGQALYTSTEVWLGESPTDEGTLAQLVKRYLAAFGPATVKDIQTWSGLTRLGAVVNRLRPELSTFLDVTGRELFDLPDAPRPDPDLPVPVRFLGAFDNMLLSYADRTRILRESDRKRLFTTNGIIRPAILVDGMVAGKWHIDQRRDGATLHIEPFQSFSVQNKMALREEGMKLLAFAAAAAPTHAIQLGED